MTPARVLLLLLVLVGATTAPTVLPAASAEAAAQAAVPAATRLTLAVPQGYADETAPVRVALTTAGGGAPVAGAVVTVERRTGGDWAVIGRPTTDEAGRATLEAVRARTSADNVFRATWAGDDTHAASSSGQVAAALRRRTSEVTVGGPTSVVDERSTVVRVQWRTGGGDPVEGPVTLERRQGEGGWQKAATLRTSADGRVELRVTPRLDSRWRARVAQRDWLGADQSPVHRVDNRPPTTPVSLPRSAPKPRVGLPRQARAEGAGANVVIRSIPDAVWRDMVGRSWHAGCPVGRAGLRLVRVNYWGFDGYRYRGELVAAVGAADNMAGALKAMYDRELPIRSMYRVDRFGWSKKLQGADDYRSMAADNTSAFNCRSVVNKPGVRSPHSYGRSLDVNPWENPYRSATGLVPNSYWHSRTHPQVAWRSRSHVVVRLMARHGLAWTYGTGDSHHFDVRGGSGRPVPRPSCGAVACE